MPEIDSEEKMFSYTPLKDLETDEILAIIKGNEELQRRIINDPVLRESLYEKFNVLKQSNSDHTLPNSFFSSKHMGERRTEGDTNITGTPMKSQESKIIALYTIRRQRKQ